MIASISSTSELIDHEKHRNERNSPLFEHRITRLTDSYKITHAVQYNPGTSNIYSYFESRGGQFAGTTFFGLQYILKKYLMGQVVDKKNLIQDEAYFAAHFGNPSLFNRAGWEYIANKHHGRLPLSIKAVPEGTTVPTHNVLMTVENTDPKCFWLTNFVETLLVQAWYPTTVCTLSRAIKEIILKYLEETGDPALISFKLHDFGFRGSTSVESAGIGGASHLVNFMGTDTLAACDVIFDYYTPEVLNESIDATPESALAFYQKYMPGFSIPASEHSTITSWGQEHELDAFRNMLERYPQGLVACVSDSFDIFRACGVLWGEKLRSKVLARNGILVIRPDSGDPINVIRYCLSILGTKFGYTTNSKGFKVLDPHVRLIQGDGVDIQSIGAILEEMKKIGWSTDNIAFGSGGALLQKMNRDTQKFAFKCSSAVVHGEEIDVFKDPITDQGKKSKKGRLALISENGQFKTVPENQLLPGSQNHLVEVFRNGDLKVDHAFADIRKRAEL